MPLFLADSGVVLMPTARHIWNTLLVENVQTISIVDSSVSLTSFNELQKVAQEHGKTIYDELIQEHRTRMIREREKGEYAFAARRRMMERVGLSQVRNHRLALLDQEEKTFHEQLEQKAHIYPDMSPLLVIRIGEP